MRAKQLSIFELTTESEKRTYKQRFVHGGDYGKGKRKLKRPIATNKWMHLVLKSKKATGKYWMLNQKHVKAVESAIVKNARKFKIELKEFVNMGNHIHFQIRTQSRDNFQRFLRTITGLIARIVTGAKKGSSFGKFWDELAFTRIITTLNELVSLEGYLQANTIEKRHGYQARKIYLMALNRWIKKLRDQGIHVITP